MILIKKTDDLQEYIAAKTSSSGRKSGNIGFVPTMGALHAGHISLIQASKEINRLTLCSIFVNPVQFNDPNDFKKYPVTIENDIYQLEKAGCDILFLPSVDEIYPDGLKPKKHYELGKLEEILEGKFRPGHFQGVCLVVDRLLEIVNPQQLYLGQKDYQQCMVIKKLVEIIGRDNSPDIIICPTLRESNGLAMSSRNMRLSPEQRLIAGGIYQSLQFIKENLSHSNISDLRQGAIEMLLQKGFKVDYTEIANASSLDSVNNWNGKDKLVALTAAFLGEIRLIDNLLLN